MYPSIRICSTRAHQPLIKFLGKRTWPTSTEGPHPHPAAPAELKQRFSDFVGKSDLSSPVMASSKELSNGSRLYNNFWEAPTRFWQPRVREIEEAELEAIMSGGASSA